MNFWPQELMQGSVNKPLIFTVVLDEQNNCKLESDKLKQKEIFSHIKSL